MPSLTAIRGPLIGARVRLTPGATSLGRDGTNTVALADPSVAPAQCVVTSAAGRVSIRNLDPAAPAFVNGLPCSDQPLQHGDQIQVGASLFVLDLTDDLTDVDRNPVHAEERPAATPSLVIRREDVYVDRGSAAPGSSTDRFPHDLAALIRITTAVSAVHGLAGLGRPLLELIAEAVPADRGALILTESRSADQSAAFGWTRGGAGTAVVHAVSRPILDRVLDERVGILGTELRESAGGPNAARWTLGAPLMAFDKLLGAIMLESDAPTAFDEGHLRLVMAIAGVVANALERARHIEWLEGENRTLRAELHGEHNMVGESASMRDLFRRIVRVAARDSTVLIRGESGTGKELVALAIHRNSARTDRPFVAINCAAIVETLLESELFGHERGAFTGAVAQKKGKLEAAEGGTVFLDEVGELSLGLQAKLLRVLQAREFERVGGIRRVHVNFRLIAATNRDLEAAIAAGAFRRDLYYRLNVISIEIPPLRRRREDVPVLAAFLARRHAQALNRPVSGISPEAMACLTAYEWPGNVRELDNAIEHAVVLGSTPFILPEDLPDAVAEAAGPFAASGSVANASAGPFHDAVKRAKRDLIRKAVAQSRGNYTAAARLLGLHPNYLHRLVRNLQLRAELKDPHATD